MRTVRCSGRLGQGGVCLRDGYAWGGVCPPPVDRMTDTSTTVADGNKVQVIDQIFLLLTSKLIK